MDNLVESQSVTKIENTIGEIDGIEAARIVANGDGIEEIHILSAPYKDVKRLGRDIESALIAKHGLAVDYRKISIAQVSAPQQPSANPNRLKLKSVSIETSGLSCRIGINLSYNEKDFEGVAQGASSSSGKKRLVAEATLKAIEKAGSDANFSLEGLDTVNLGSRQAVCVCVNVANDGIENCFTGSSIKNEGSENESIVKAILAAVNRRFSLL